MMGKPSAGIRRRTRKREESCHGSSVEENSRHSTGDGLTVLWWAEDEVTRLGLPILLARVPGITRSRIVANGREAVRAISAGDVDLAVLPIGGCAEFFLRLPAEQTPPRVLVNLDRADPGAIRSFAWHHRVTGYLRWRDVTAVGLATILDRLARGEPTVPDEVVHELLDIDRPAAAGTEGPGIGRLTEREHAVLARLAKGMSNHQIARTMQISVHGVKRHVSNLLVKLECSNRTEVALIAARLGMESALRPENGSNA